MTFAYPTITLAGEPVLATTTAQWSLRPGVEPVVEEFDLRPASRAVLSRYLGRPEPVTLSYLGTSYENLFVLREDPAANEHIYRVLVADRRYLWRFRHVHERINLRRRVGVKRRGAWDDRGLVGVDRSALEQSAAAFTYRRWTVEPDTLMPYSPRQLLRRIMRLVDRDAKVTLDPNVTDLQTPIEDLELDDPGNVAIQRMLSYLPGATVTVDPDGGVRFYFVPDDRDEALHGALSPEIVGGGHTIRLRDTLDRPSKIRVKFSWQVEMRFDFLDDAAGDEDALKNETPKGSVTPRRLENVLEVPDHRLALPDGREVAQGTWLTFAEAWQAWIAQDPPTGSLGTALRDSVREAFIPDMGLWSALDLWGRFDRNGIESGRLRNWAARIAAVQQHYRTSFRLPKDWLDRVLHIHPYLVGTWDRVTGSRAAAVAYGGYAVRPAQKGFYLEGASGARDLFYAFNVPGYPGTNAPITSASKPSPAVVSVVDADQGILRLDYRVSRYGIEDMIWPSLLEGVPNRNPDDFGRSTVAWNATFDETGDDVPRLAASHAVAVLFTVTPATTILYEVVVEPRDVLGLLPASVRDRIGDTAHGPELDLRIGPGIESARVAWSDDPDLRRVVEGLFYPENIAELRDRPDQKDAVVSNRLRSLVTNDAEQAAIGERAASLRNIALAAAASAWARWAERPIGTISGAYDGGLRLAGATADLAHTTSTEGVSTTRATFLPAVEPLSMFGLMDGSTRRILMRTLDGNL